MTLPRRFFGVVHPDDSQDQHEQQHSPTPTRKGGRPSIDAALLDTIHGLTLAEGFCWASNNFLANQRGCTPRAVQAALDRLEEEGRIYREYPAGSARRIYVIPHEERGEEIPPVPMKKGVKKLVSSPPMKKGLSSPYLNPIQDRDKKQQQINRGEETRRSVSSPQRQEEDVVVAFDSDWEDADAPDWWDAATSTRAWQAERRDADWVSPEELVSRANRWAEEWDKERERIEQGEIDRGCEAMDD